MIVCGQKKVYMVKHRRNLKRNKKNRLKKSTEKVFAETKSHCGFLMSYNFM